MHCILKDGTFNKDILQEKCQICPEGFYCVGDKSQDPVSCPVGFYCTNGTGYDWKPCPKGTYSKSVGLKKQSGKIKPSGTTKDRSFNVP
jgi:hypothetical protein